MKLLSLFENKAARTNALRKQQELIDRGYRVEVLKLPDGAYCLIENGVNNHFCTLDGQVIYSNGVGTRPIDVYYLYARDILQAPFPAGEKEIATSEHYAYKYARDVLKGPFPAGEPALATNAYYGYLYALDVLKAPFPAGEKILAKESGYAVAYAKYVLKAPFPAGTPEIMRSKHKAEYEKFLASLKK